MGDDKLLILIIISVTGMVLSAVFHFSSLFHIYQPPRELTILIWIGALVVIYPAIVIEKKTRKGVNVKDYKKAVLGVCPGWLLAVNGLIIMYVIGYIIFLIFEKFFGSPDVDSGQGVITNLTHGFAGHWMAFYSISFMTLYSSKRIKETRSGNGKNVGKK